MLGLVLFLLSVDFKVDLEWIDFMFSSVLFHIDHGREVGVSVRFCPKCRLGKVIVVPKVISALGTFLYCFRNVGIKVRWGSVMNYV